MKLNNSFLEKLREKNISLDVRKFKEKLASSYKSNNETKKASSKKKDVEQQQQYSSSEVESNESSSLTGSNRNIQMKPPTHPSSTLTQSSFRVRPLTQQQQSEAPDSFSLSITQSLWAKKTTDFQNPTPTQTTSSTFNDPKKKTPVKALESFASTAKTPTTTTSSSTQSSAANLFTRTNTSSFSYERPSSAQSTASSTKRPLTGIAAHLQRKNSISSNGNSATTAAASIGTAQSTNAMTVSIYKDNEQNRLREDLLQYDENENDQQSDENLSEYFENDNEGDFDGDSKEAAATADPFEIFLDKYSSMTRDQLELNFEQEAQLQQLQQQVEEEFISETITVEVIERITKSSQEEFPLIRRATLRHDCSNDSLQLFGEMLPNLQELNMNDSITSCLRDLGTSLRQLRVIFLSRVHLKDLSGINAFPLLVELYASYNQITNLNDLYFHENLEILDFEGNDISDVEAIEALETLPKLKELNLSLNPIATSSIQKQSTSKSSSSKINHTTYRQLVISKLPNLLILDDLSTSELTDKKDNKNKQSNNNDDDDDDEEEEDLYESLKKLNWGGEKFLSNDVVTQLDQELKNELSEEALLLFSVKRTSSKVTKQHSLASSMFPISEQASAFSTTNRLGSSNIFAQNSTTALTSATSRRPQSASSRQNLSSQQSSANISNPFKAQTSKNSILQMGSTSESQSDLVGGTDMAFCGNPLKALKHKRKGDLITSASNAQQSEEGQAAAVAIPKNIVNLLDQFKHDTNNDEISRLKDELKMYDFMVEKQLQIKPRSTARPQISANKRTILPVNDGLFGILAAASTSKGSMMRNTMLNLKQQPAPPSSETADSQNNEVEAGISDISEKRSNSILFKRQVLKMRVPSQPHSMNSDQKSAISSHVDSLINPELKPSLLPLPFKDLKSKIIRTPIRPLGTSSLKQNLLATQQ